MDYMVIFDIIILGLGIYEMYSAFKMKKDRVVGNLFVASEELPHCKNMDGFIDYLYPKAVIFGVISIVFGVECLIDDLLLDVGNVINAIALIAFLGSWIWFSHMLRKGRTEFF